MSNYYDSDCNNYDCSNDYQKQGRNNSCNCKSDLTCAEYLNNILNSLFCTSFKKLFIPSSFTLYTSTTYTAPDATTIKSLPSCNNNLVEFSDGSALNYASICNLTGLSFLLNDPTTTLPLITSALKNLGSNCKYPCYSECNSGKAQKLCAALDTVNLQVYGSIGYLANVNVLDVAENAVWVVEINTAGSPPVTTARVYVICLDNIEFIG
ncbi:MAG: hypothetical protein ACRCTE_14130 [Cellulosilyticaceae bacterium]